MTFDVYDELATGYVQKCHAYAEADIAAELHPQHCYRVSFNDDPKHPNILRISEEVACASLDITIPPTTAVLDSQGET